MSPPSEARISTCALCPRLCRTACPVATGTAREAAVPALLGAVMLEYSRGRATTEELVEAITLCTDCGACQERCHIDQPLPAMLREARAAHLPVPDIAPLQPIQGEGDWIAVEADDRPLAAALSRRLGRPIRRWVTRDRLGVAAVEHPRFEAHARALRAQAGEATVVVVDGGVAHALQAAGIAVRWLHEVVLDLPQGEGSCRAGGSRPLACCGAGGPLVLHHPVEAERVGQMWLDRAERWQVRDARCRGHLRGCGGVEVSDPLDALLEQEQ